MSGLGEWPLIAGCALAGLLVGSFANVAIHRWPRRGSVLRPSASRCPSCDAQIRPSDNIPLVSWFLLRGRCRSCGATIAWRYPVVEGLVAVIWALIAVVHGPVAELPALLAVGWALVVATVIDLEHRIIPNALTYRLAPLTLLLLVAAAAVSGDWADLRRSLLVGVLLPLSMFLLREVYRLVRGRIGLGLGDVKLAVTLGLVLGYLGGWEVVIGLYATIIAAVLVVAALLLGGRVGLASRIPFGPYLAAGTLTAVLAGRPLSRVVGGWLGFA